MSFYRRAFLRIGLLATLGAGLYWNAEIQENNRKYVWLSNLPAKAAISASGHDGLKDFNDVNSSIFRRLTPVSDSSQVTREHRSKMRNFLQFATGKMLDAIWDEAQHSTIKGRSDRNKRAVEVLAVEYAARKLDALSSVEKRLLKNMPRRDRDRLRQALQRNISDLNIAREKARPVCAFLNDKRTRTQPLTHILTKCPKPKGRQLRTIRAAFAKELPWETGFS